MPNVIVLKSETNINELYNNLNNKLIHNNVDAKAELQEDAIKIISNNSNVQKINDLLAEETCQFIIDNLEKQEISKIIYNGYPFFNNMEKKELLDEVRKLLEKDNIDNDLFLIRRKKIIKNALNEYLNQKKSLCIDGFLPFRLKSYLMELEDFVDRAADDYLTYKEYTQFLGLLKYFVDMQDAKVDNVQVIAFDKGNYILIDETGNEIADDDTLELVSEISTNDISNDDLLLSSLINLAPKNIKIHNWGSAKPEIMDTLNKVFTGRIIFCDGCNWCKLGSGDNGYLH